jgi:hypothetical protein
MKLLVYETPVLWHTYICDATLSDVYIVFCYFLSLYYI